MRTHPAKEWALKLVPRLNGADFDKEVKELNKWRRGGLDRSVTVIEKCRCCGDSAEFHAAARRDLCTICRVAYKKIASSAAAAVARSIREGIKQKACCSECVDCGRQASEYDHRNYKNKLRVSPVCRRCNVIRGFAEPFRSLIGAAKLKIGKPYEASKK